MRNVSAILGAINAENERKTWNSWETTAKSSANDIGWRHRIWRTWNEKHVHIFMRANCVSWKMAVLGNAHHRLNPSGNYHLARLAIIGYWLASFHCLELLSLLVENVKVANICKRKFIEVIIAINQQIVDRFRCSFAVCFYSIRLVAQIERNANIHKLNDKYGGHVMCGAYLPVRAGRTRKLSTDLCIWCLVHLIFTCEAIVNAAIQPTDLH